jgi:protein-S-isoprenylcysteine O-methyltransferase Ste14
MKRLSVLLYGIAAYEFAMVNILYAIGFVGNLVVPKSIDVGAAAAWQYALPVDLALLGLFALQHSVMARQGFKRWATQHIPQPVERSTYVLFASAALTLLFWQWRAMPEIVWTVGNPAARQALYVLFWVGWVLVPLSTFLINHFELFGLQQVINAARGRESRASDFKTPGLYKVVRHPIYLGFIVAFWAAPDMTLGHLVFALATTGYILIGIALEERDLVHRFGERYLQYRREVRMLLPWPRRAEPAALADEKPQ